VAEAGSFGGSGVKQADIVRVVGRIRPSEKVGPEFQRPVSVSFRKDAVVCRASCEADFITASAAAWAETFSSFVMEMEKISFPEAIRAVAEKMRYCGAASAGALAGRTSRKPAAHVSGRDATAKAAAFFAQQLNGTPEGRAAKAYLMDRGLDSEAMARFGIGFAPSGGEALLRVMKQKHPEKVWKFPAC